MARKKVIQKEQIIRAAYDLVSKHGFSRFTARNIAAKMKCSTQPIYLEFKNMDDLKAAVIDRIHDNLAKKVFPVEHTGDPIVDLTLNYIGFAKKESQIYRALFTEDNSGGEAVQSFAFEFFTNAIKEDKHYKNLTQIEIESLHTGCWIVATGLASLISSGIIDPTIPEIIKLMNETIDSILQRDTPIEISYRI